MNPFGISRPFCLFSIWGDSAAPLTAWAFTDSLRERFGIEQIRVEHHLRRGRTAMRDRIEFCAQRTVWSDIRARWSA